MTKTTKQQESEAKRIDGRRGLGLVMRIGLALGGFCVLLGWALPAMATVVGRPPDSGNCYPFGCARDGEYQQVYSSSLFSRPITITDLEFYDTQVNSGATAMNSGTWTIFLSTTSADWNTLSGTFANNLGSNNTMVFTGDLAQPWTFGDVLHIDLGTAFTYDPTQGNLLLDVTVSGASEAGGRIFFDCNGCPAFHRNTYFARLTAPGGPADQGVGLVTGFSTNVPEPGNLTLFGLGALLIGTFVGLRRRIAYKGKNGNQLQFSMSMFKRT